MRIFDVGFAVGHFIVNDLNKVNYPDLAHIVIDFVYILSFIMRESLCLCLCKVVIIEKIRMKTLCSKGSNRLTFGVKGTRTLFNVFFVQCKLYLYICLILSEKQFVEV